MKPAWHIRGGRIVDPSNGRDETGDLWIRDGIIVDSPRSRPEDTREIDAAGLVVAPGFLDMHVHLRQPGNEEAETLESGSRAAARGGFTALLAMPNTDPPTDSPDRVKALVSLAGECTHAKIMFTGCMTAGRDGSAAADMHGMSAAGAVAFTDDGSTVPDDEVMAAAMRTAAALNTPVLDHALDPAMAGNGVMREGEHSRRLGLPGIPARAEVAAVERDLALCAGTGCRLHVQHVSAGESVDIIGDGIARGLGVSGEATPHHLALTDADVPGDDPDFKMNPPLGTEEDRQSLIAAIASGTLRVLATDHAPHRGADKEKGFREAPFGIVGLETAIGVTYGVLVKSGIMPTAEWVDRWTAGPASVLGIPTPSLSVGSPGDVSILDLESEWTVRRDAFVSRSHNTPFEGRKVTGMAVYTFCDGVMTWNSRR